MTFLKNKSIVVAHERQGNTMADKRHKHQKSGMIDTVLQFLVFLLQVEATVATVTVASVAGLLLACYVMSVM